MNQLELNLLDVLQQGSSFSMLSESRVALERKLGFPDAEGIGMGKTLICQYLKGLIEVSYEKNFVIMVGFYLNKYIEDEHLKFCFNVNKIKDLEWVLKFLKDNDIKYNEIHRYEDSVSYQTSNGIALVCEGNSIESIQIQPERR